MSHNQLQFLFLLTVQRFYILGYKEYNKFDISIDRLVMSMYRVMSCIVGSWCFLFLFFFFFVLHRFFIKNVFLCMLQIFLKRVFQICPCPLTYQAPFSLSLSFYFSFFILIAALLLLFQLEANYFTILWWVLSYTEMNQPWIYMCSPS